MPLLLTMMTVGAAAIPRHGKVAAGSSCTLPLTLAEGETCTLTWAELKPSLRTTQMAIGYAWALHKFAKFDSAESAQSEIDDSPLPVAKGPNGDIFLLDHHHELAALDYSGYADTKATLVLACDVSDMVPDAAWEYLVSRAFAYPYGRPAGSATTLPSHVERSELPLELTFQKANQTMVDDPWRSLASFVRKVKGLASCPKGNKYCMRAYDRVCTPDHQGIPFFEFRWGFFFNDAAFQDTSLWQNATAKARFDAAYPQIVGNVSDEDAWLSAAVELVYLARGASAAAYAVPAELGAMGGPLPGVVTGLAPIPDEDPDCDAPMC